MDGPFSPSLGKTPTVFKNPRFVQSSVNAKIVDRVVSSNNGRKLFDSAAAIPDTMKVDVSNLSMYLERTLSSSIAPKDVKLPNEIRDFPQQRFDDAKEERSRDHNTLKTLDLHGTPFDKGNLHSPTSIVGSPLTRQKTLRKILSPISSNITPIEHLSSDDKIRLAFLEPKNPKTPYVINCAKDETGLIGTPLDKFNALSSNLKESLAQEYLAFLNVASKEELMQLKGIGQKRAEYILELRENSPNPLKSLSDLEKIGLSSRQVHDMFGRAARGIFA